VRIVLHVITGLDRGGAQSVMFRLASRSKAWKSVVVSLTDRGVYGPQLEAQGIPVHVLGMPRGKLSIKGLWSLYRAIRNVRPDVVQTWMYHADLVGGLTARLTSAKAVIWGIRNSNLSPRSTSRATRGVVRVCAVLSRWIPTAIACCSTNAAKLHAELGYAERKLVVIPNGYDLARFAPSRQARDRLRAAWGVPVTSRLIGCVARWHPQKDHQTLLRAIRMVADRQEDVRWVLVGPGMEATNANLESMIDRSGLRGKLILAGPREDVADVMNALDLHVLASAYGEAFPNVVAESMACGTPALSTDVGDAAFIIGKCGWIVPPSNPSALAAAIDEFLGLEAQQHADLASRGRNRIVELFDIDKMTAAYEALWLQSYSEKFTKASVLRDFGGISRQ